MVVVLLSKVRVGKDGGSVVLSWGVEAAIQMATMGAECLEETVSERLYVTVGVDSSVVLQL